MGNNWSLLLLLLPLLFPHFPQCVVAASPPFLLQQFDDNLVANVGSPTASASAGDGGDMLLFTVPNLYRWIHQNAHICENSIGGDDSAMFLTEFEAEQFNCLALCGDWEGGKACAKRRGQTLGGKPSSLNCESVPELCLLNFRQEFFPLQISLDGFSTAMTTTTKTTTTTASPPERAQQHEMVVTTSNSTTSAPAADEQQRQPMVVEGNTDNGRAEELTVVDGEVGTATGAGSGRRPTAAVTVDAANAVSPSSSLSSFAPSVPVIDASGVAGATTTRFPAPLPLLSCPATDVDVISCAWWQRVGECTRNVRFMQRVCRRTCGFCDASPPSMGNSAKA